jgi:chromosome segregation protein
MDKARSELEQDKHSLALKEGENQIVSAEAAQAQERLDTVTWEVNNLGTDDTSRQEDRKSLADEIERVRNNKERLAQTIRAGTEKLHDLEGRHAELQADLTKHSIKSARLAQEVEHLRSRHQTVEERLTELRTMMNSRSDGIVSYKGSIEKFKDAIKEAEEEVVSLASSVEANDAESESLQKNKDKQSRELEALEEALATKRRLMDQFLKDKSDLDLKLSENTMRRQNHMDRAASEYGMTIEQMMNEPEPEWKDEKPETDVLETQIAELRTKLEAMGPVNLVAIEEHRELEERHAFLTKQEEDLVNSKQQLLEMIRKINRTTSEMFRTTFAQVNKNFESTFTKLFNGGSAKLVLVNEEDVLECGIEIIAKPPGKRLQNISLLSGGERTLTAVSLLFAIYMIKPSPFCLLDELDAALDESNIGRFVSILREFLDQSQFVVITHNRQTIAASNVLYGVTMPEKGVSRIVSMKFSEAVGG